MNTSKWLDKLEDIVNEARIEEMLDAEDAAIESERNSDGDSIEDMLAVYGYANKESEMKRCKCTFGERVQGGQCERCKLYSIASINTFAIEMHLEKQHIFDTKRIIGALEYAAKKAAEEILIDE